METIIGIDTGSNGGIVIWKKDRLESVVKMPKGLPELKNYFDYIKQNNENVIVFIEKVQMYMSDSDSENRGKQFRIQKLLENYTQIIALITFYGFKYIEVYPISWQSNLGFKTKGMPKTERKNRYKETAEIVFPEAKVSLWNADALLILKFGLNKLRYDEQWVTERLKNTKTQSLF